MVVRHPEWDGRLWEQLGVVARRSYKEVSDRAEYRVEVTDRELERLEAIGPELLAPDNMTYPDVDANSPSPDDRRYHDAGGYVPDGYTGRGIVVGVSDNGLGCSSKYSVKAARSEIGLDPLTSAGGTGHGDFCASIAVPQASQIVVGQSDNGIGGADSDRAASLNWMVDQVGVDVVNMSFSGDSLLPLLESAINNARSKGVVVFASAGNQGVSAQRYPAAYPGVYAVGAMDRTTDARASFSNHGPWVDMWCSGVRLPAYGPNCVLGVFTGTSASCPMAVWLWASIRGKVKRNAPHITGDQTAQQMGKGGSTAPAVGGGGGGKRVDGVDALNNHKALC